MTALVWHPKSHLNCDTNCCGDTTYHEPHLNRIWTASCESHYTLFIPSFVLLLLTPTNIRMVWRNVTSTLHTVAPCCNAKFLVTQCHCQYLWLDCVHTYMYKRVASFILPIAGLPIHKKVFLISLIVSTTCIHFPIFSQPQW